MDFSKVILLVVAVMVVIMEILLIVPCQALGKRRGHGDEFVFCFLVLLK